MILIASCNNQTSGEKIQEKSRKECQRQCPHQDAECKKRCEMMTEEEKADMEKWKNFDNLTVEEQRSLLSKSKAAIDKKDAEMKAAKEDFETKWNNFENLTIAEQKELIDKRAKFYCPTMQGPKGMYEKGKPGMEKK
jgi:hypothetical protein